MANSNAMGIADLTFSASTDLSAAQYKFVRPTTAANKSVVLANGASGPVPYGVLQNDPVAGEAAQVRVYGTSQVWFSGSGALEAGEFIVSGSAGGAEKAALSSVNGIALEAISAGSGYIEVLLVPFFSAFADNTP